MIEHNYDCNVGAENFPSVEEQEQNNKTRNHSCKCSNFI